MKIGENRRSTAESHPIPPCLASRVFAPFFEGPSGNPKNGFRAWHARGQRFDPAILRKLKALSRKRLRDFGLLPDVDVGGLTEIGPRRRLDQYRCLRTNESLMPLRHGGSTLFAVRRRHAKPPEDERKCNNSGGSRGVRNGHDRSLLKGSPLRSS